MMLPKEILWFSSRCPYFTVFDAKAYYLFTNLINISEEKLRECGFYKAANWLSKNTDCWKQDLVSFYKEAEVLSGTQGGVLFFGQEDYPENLKNIFHPPTVLFYRGNIKLLKQLTVGVVGSRQPTELGRKWVESTVPELVQESIVIISGGARGIDYEAHMQSMLCKGSTIVFLPGGVIHPYPHSHKRLFENILSQNGLIVSEFMSQDEVRKENFHQRNRLISACSEILIVVEAGMKSGTMMTATKAIEQNKDIFVLPGSPLIKNYEGSLELISQGAGLVRSAQDILNELSKRKNLKK